MMVRGVDSYAAESRAASGRQQYERGGESFDWPKGTANPHQQRVCVYVLSMFTAVFSVKARGIVIKLAGGGGGCPHVSFMAVVV